MINTAYMLVRAGSGMQAARGNRNGRCDGVQGVTGRTHGCFGVQWHGRVLQHAHRGQLMGSKEPLFTQT